MMMKTAYLAARFSRKEDLRSVVSKLTAHGIHNIASWVTGAHDYTGVPDDEIPIADQALFAEQDLEEINRAQMFILFTDKPGDGGSRGGKHVEFGFALATRKPIVIIGPLENIFCSWAVHENTNVRHFESLDEFLNDWTPFQSAGADDKDSHWHQFVRWM